MVLGNGATLGCHVWEHFEFLAATLETGRLLKPLLWPEMHAATTETELLVDCAPGNELTVRLKTFVAVIAFLSCSFSGFAGDRLGIFL